MNSLRVLYVLLSIHAFGLTSALELRSVNTHRHATSICSEAVARHVALGKLCTDLALLESGSTRSQSTAQSHQTELVSQEERACAADVTSYRAKLLTETAGYCEEMCKLLNADGCPQCKSDDSDNADAEPPTGAMTWDDLLQHMEDVQAWGQDLMFELNKKHGS
mmetsp:Transcript_13338/g.30419  ORF Transcript_13338/g.30419 Transcript_13338/m.30419 type:complete len:164 (-) Transcript_13338:26-517(-)|eukprot:402543-Amphidinium_carterae.2